MYAVTFERNALEEYFAWHKDNIKTVRKINSLISDIQKNGFLNGIGKPEKLKHRRGYSRRIDDKNRLIYDGQEGVCLQILACKGHYDD